MIQSAHRDRIWTQNTTRWILTGPKTGRKITVFFACLGTFPHSHNHTVRWKIMMTTFWNNDALAGLTNRLNRITKASTQVPLVKGERNVWNCTNLYEWFIQRIAIGFELRTPHGAFLRAREPEEKSRCFSRVWALFHTLTITRCAEKSWWPHFEIMMPSRASQTDWIVLQRPVHRFL